MLDQVQLEAVVISTPHSMHYEQAKHCIEHNLHVLVDKPLACSFGEAKELVELAEQKDRVLVVANQRRYGDACQYMFEIIRSGQLGGLRAIQCLLGQSIRADFFSGWRSDPSMNCGGILMDSGYHLLDTLLWICGLSPKRVWAELSNDNLMADRYCSMLIEFRDNVMATATILRGAPLDSEQEAMVFYGTEGAMTYCFSKLAGKESAYLAHLDAKGVILMNNTAIPKPKGWEPTADFLDAVQLGRPPVSSGHSNLPTVALIEAAYRSGRTHNIETLEEHP